MALIALLLFPFAIVIYLRATCIREVPEGLFFILKK
jgi:hypothetical protein